MTVTTPPGQVLRDADGVRLEFHRAYDTPPRVVWAALTEPEQVARWFGRWTGDPSTGAVELEMSEEEGAPPQRVAIRVCDAPIQLLVEMPSPDGTWRLSVQLQGSGGGTALTFVQRLAEPYDASSIGPGWHYYLDRLDAVVADDPVPAEWDDYYPALTTAYALPDA